MKWFIVLLFVCISCGERGKQIEEPEDHNTFHKDYFVGYNRGYGKGYDEGYDRGHINGVWSTGERWWLYQNRHNISLIDTMYMQYDTVVTDTAVLIYIKRSVISREHDTLCYRMVEDCQTERKP
jgi:hypothetical protein